VNRHLRQAVRRRDLERQARAERFERLAGSVLAGLVGAAALATLAYAVLGVNAR